MPTSWGTGKSQCNGLEEGLPSGTCKPWCPSGRTGTRKWLPLHYFSSGHVPVVSCLFRRLSKIRPRLLSNDCVLAGSKSMWYFVCTIPKASSSPACWPSKPEILGAGLPGVGCPGRGPDAGRTQTPRSSGRTPSTLPILPFVGHLCRGCGSSLSVLLYCCFLLCILVVENLSC